MILFSTHSTNFEVLRHKKQHFIFILHLLSFHNILHKNVTKSTSLIYVTKYTLTFSYKYQKRNNRLIGFYKKKSKTSIFPKNENIYLSGKQKVDFNSKQTSLCGYEIEIITNQRYLLLQGGSAVYITGRVVSRNSNIKR